MVEYNGSEDYWTKLDQELENVADMRHGKSWTWIQELGLHIER